MKLKDQITIYEDTIQEMFEELWEDYEAEENKNRLDLVSKQIAFDFKRVWGKPLEIIEKEVYRLIRIYIYNFENGYSYNPQNAVDRLVHTLIGDNFIELAEQLLDQWRDLSEFEKYLEEIEILSDPTNVKKYIEECKYV